MAASECRRSCEIELAMRPMVASCSDSSRSCWLFSRLAAHAVEGPGEFRDFISSAGIERMMEIAGFKRADAVHQIAQRAGESMR